MNLSALHAAVLVLPWLAVGMWNVPRHLALQTVTATFVLASIHLAGGTRPGLDGCDELSLWLLPYVALIYLVILLFMPRSERDGASFRRLLAGLGLDLWFVSLQSPVWLALLWPLTHLPLFAQLRNDRWTRRMLLLYLVPGWLFFAVGALGLSGHPPLWALVSLVLAIGLRKALFPAHQWLPALAERAPLGQVVAFCTPQLGAYAIVRLLSGRAPEELLVGLGVVALFTSLYAACLGVGNRSLRGVYASLFMGQTSLVYAGLQCTSETGIAGGLAVWMSSGLALTGLGVTIWALEARRGRLPLDRYHGGYARSPVLASCYLVLGLTCVGFPCSVGFLAQELLLDGTMHVYPHVGILAALTACLNGITVMRSYFHLFCGSREEYGYSQSIRNRERVALILLLAALIGVGVWPQPFFSSRSRIAHEVLLQRQAAGLGSHQGFRDE